MESFEQNPEISEFEPNNLGMDEIRRHDAEIETLAESEVMKPGPSQADWRAGTLVFVTIGLGALMAADTKPMAGFWIRRERKPRN